MRIPTCVACLALIFLGSDLAPMAQEASPSSKEKVSANAAKAAQFAVVEAKRYEIHHQGQDDRTLELTPQPVLRWSNPTDGEVHGGVMLWTCEGCPEVAASIYQFFDRKQVNIELVSLSESALEAKRNKRVRWLPKPGVKFMPLADAPVPADTPAKRQLQMRALSRKFTGALADRGEDETLSVLRLMARPLHQYQSTTGPERDGAVFGLVSTTDPEILLIIESRATAKGREWVYAAARMHFCRVQLKLDDKVVWEASRVAPPWDKIRGPEGEYVILEWPSEEAAAKD